MTWLNGLDGRLQEVHEGFVNVCERLAALEVKSLEVEFGKLPNHQIDHLAVQIGGLV